MLYLKNRVLIIIKLFGYCWMFVINSSFIWYKAFLFVACLIITFRLKKCNFIEPWRNFSQWKFCFMLFIIVKMLKYNRLCLLTRHPPFYWQTQRVKSQAKTELSTLPYYLMPRKSGWASEAADRDGVGTRSVQGCPLVLIWALNTNNTRVRLYELD